MRRRSCRACFKVLHQLWIHEGYTSPVFLAAAQVAFPSAAVEVEQLILQEVRDSQSIKFGCSVQV